MTMTGKTTPSVAVLLAVCCVWPARADVNLEWRPLAEVVDVEDTVDIGLFAVSDDETDQLMAGIDVIVTWDATRLELLGHEDNGPYDWLLSFFADDRFLDRLNEDCADDLYCSEVLCDDDADCPGESACNIGLGFCPFTFSPYNDGDAFFQVASAIVGDPAAATPDGLLVTTLQFRALAPGLAHVEFLAEFGDNSVTQVLSGKVINLPITGELGPAAEITVLGDIQCQTFQDCADVDVNGIRDDNCLWWECTDTGACLSTAVPFGDMGGQFGLCMPDGTPDGNDRFHALNCFADVDPGSPPPNNYPCEAAAPVAFNVDAGGQFGSCAPDGVCDGNDAFAALNAFAGASTCTCPGGPAPDSSGSVIVDHIGVALEAPHTVVRPGTLLAIDVLLEHGTPDLRGYQLHLEAAGGLSGTLELVDIAVHDHVQHVFAGLAPWQAFNVLTGQMVAGLDSSGIAASGGDYLATYYFRASADAAGTFSIALLHDVASADHRTFLFPTQANGQIAIVSSNDVQITIEPYQKITRKREGSGSELRRTTGK